MEDLLEEMFSKIRPDVAPGEADGAEEDSAAPPTGPSNSGQEGWGQGPIRISVDAEERVNFAMHHNKIPVVRRLAVKNVGDQVLEMVKISLHLDVGNLEDEEFADTVTLRLERIGPAEEFVFNSVPLLLKSQAMVRLDEEVAGHLYIKARVDEVVHGSHVHEIGLLAFNQWNAAHPAKQILAAHVQPNHPAVKEVLQGAQVLIEKRTGDSSLQGYQSGPERVKQIAHAIYDTLGDRDIKYINPPAGWEKTGQKVRAPDQVLDDRQGTCIDLACVYASCLEQAGLHPVIYVIEGHAFAGVFLQETSLKSPVTDEVNLVLNLQDENIVLPIEAVGFTSKLGFDDAITKGRGHLHNPSCFDYLLDIRSARLTERILPLPDRRRNEQGALEVHETQIVIGPVGPELPRAEVEEGDGGYRPERDLPPRIKKWQRDLLDLTLRNPLLNFRPKKSALSFILPRGTLGILEDQLAKGVGLTLQAQDHIASIHDEHGGRVASEIFDKDQVAHFLEGGALPVAHDGVRTLKICRALFRKARTLEEETGTNHLYAVLGVLAWKEGVKNVESPLILMPARLSKPSVKRPTLLVADEGAEAVINFCLVHKLRDEFELDLKILETPKLDANGVDVEWVLSTVRQKIREKGLPFSVDESAHLAVLSFGKYQLWHDLEHRSHALMDNPVVRHLVETPNLPYDDPKGRAEESTVDLESEVAYCPLPCDSSQLNAVIEAGKGRSFVLQGPPGTGKSQTITNLVAHCLANGKKVLFVAEKAAALHVVKRRLDKVGLGASCLELHSKATSLPAVKRQFEEAMDLKPGQDPEGWERDKGNYEQSRERLSGYVGALHDPMPIGLSPYWAQERKTKLGAGKEAPVPAAFFERGKEDCAAVLNLLKQAEGAGKDAGARLGHPWSISRLLSLDGFDEQQWGELTSRMEGVLKEPLLEGLTGLETLEGSCDLAHLKQLQDLLTLDGRGLLLEESTVDAFNRPAWAAAVQAVFESLERLEDARKKVEEGYELESLEDEDLADLLDQAKRASTSWPILKWLRFRSVLVRMQQCAREGHKVRARSVETDIKAARKIPRVQDELRSLISDVPSPGFPFGDVAGRPKLITKARERHEAALTVAALTKGEGIVAESVRSYLNRPLGAEAKVRAENIAELHDVFSGICDVLQSDRAAQISWRADKSLLDAIRASLQEWRGATAIHSLRRWTTFWGLLRKVSDHGLEDFALAVAGGEVELGDMRECFMRGLSARLVDHALRERSALRGFDDKAHTRELNRFKELDAKIAEGYYQVVPRILYESRPRGLKDTALKELGQVGLLSRWVGRKRGGDTVRKVLEQWPGAVTALKPCFLMSPASVAQYLPVDTEGKGMQFDVVIFDEASQIPVPDAIGAVARGKSLVVVGDSKQMPPTAFFKAADDEDSELGPDLLVEDAESILTECEQANLPALWLNWHYRSRHESLIAFSNAHYYEGRLTSFPSPHKTSSRYGVSFHKVDGGYYDTGKTRTNPPEADAIVQEIARMCADPVECKRSIGVVTFNMQQQELVLDKLEDRAESLPALKAAMDGDGVEPLFVKNLENVQGDERDIILFSICYGPTKEGKAPSMNFGPLNRAGGERRLNVAVTRAREKVQVFATLLPGMIDLSRTNSIGAAHLKAFLEMAQKGTSGEVSSQAAQGCDKDAYRAEIAAALRGRGLTVREQLGMSEFKVDLALGVDESAEVFRAAVLLDGPGYRDLPTTRDRDSIPPLMLEDLGWAIYRIWLPAWVHERDRLLDEIEELVRTPPGADGPQEQEPTAPEIPEAPSTDDAVGSRVNLEGSAGESTSTIKAPPDSEPETTGASMYEGGELFVPFEGGRALGTKEDFELGAGIENGVREVLAAEGPVQADRLGQLVARRFGFKRVPSARVKTVLDHLPTRARRHRSSFGEFIWPEDKAPDSWAGFRYSVERGERSVDELAAEEVRNLMLQATHESLGLSRTELLRLCADVFSLGNLGKKIVARLDSILEWALAEGVLVDQDGVIVPGP